MLVLTAFLAVGASAADLHCRTDADCAAGYECAAQKTACPTRPESSTCVERLCRKKPGWPVTEADRVCESDRDCALVMLGCVCMYCARPTDFQEGVVAPVSRRRAKAYAKLGQCSPEQLRGCAMAGACAVTGTSSAVCRDGRCAVEYTPR